MASPANVSESLELIAKAADSRSSNKVAKTSKLPMVVVDKDGNPIPTDQFLQDGKIILRDGQILELVGIPLENVKVTNFAPNYTEGDYQATIWMGNQSIQLEFSESALFRDSNGHYYTVPDYLASLSVPADLYQFQFEPLKSIEFAYNGTHSIRTDFEYDIFDRQAINSTLLTPQQLNIQGRTISATHVVSQGDSALNSGATPGFHTTPNIRPSSGDNSSDVPSDGGDVPPSGGDVPPSDSMGPGSGGGPGAGPVMNQEPLVFNYVAGTDEDTIFAAPFAFGLLSLAFDPDGDPLTIVAINGNGSNIRGGFQYTTSHNAIVTVGINGAFTYNPNGQFETLSPFVAAVEDTFTYTVSDGQGGLVTTTASIIVSGVVDPPFSFDASVFALEDTHYLFTSSDFPFFDIDETDTLQGITINSLPALGTLQYDGFAVFIGQFISTTDLDNRLLSFTPAPNEFSLNYASFDFTVNDGILSSDLVNMSINVSAVNDAPVAEITNFGLPLIDDVADVFAGAIININGFLSTDIEDGFIANYSWTQIYKSVGGAADILIVDPLSADPFAIMPFIFGSSVNYILDLAVTDLNGVTSHDSILIRLNAGLDAGDNSIEGTAGDDFLFGDPFGATEYCILGLDGDDIINGFSGSDYIFGGSGNDTIYASTDTFNDSIYDGGIGTDTLSFVNRLGPDGVTVDLGSVMQVSGEQIIQVENVTGSGFADILFGNEQNNTLAGQVGADLIRGGGGNDIIDVGIDIHTDIVEYTSFLDGHDTINNFDVLNDQINLDGLFDDLGIPLSDRAADLQFTQQGADTVISFESYGNFSITVTNTATTDWTPGINLILT